MLPRNSLLVATFRRQAPTSLSCRIVRRGPCRARNDSVEVQLLSRMMCGAARRTTSNVKVVYADLFKIDARWDSFYAKSIVRCFSSESGSGGSGGDRRKSVSDCARGLAAIGKEIASGGRESAVAMEVAEALSPSARKELSLVAEEIVSDRPQSKVMAEAESKKDGVSSDTQKETESVVEEPSRYDLRLVALNQSVPFIGFGLMDNAILILAGDAIDTTLGVVLGISTLCAAAIGNIISDIAGVMLGTVIEDFSSKLGMPVPNITQAQRQLRSVRFAGQFGCAVGITIGCVIGMFPLLFIDTNKVEKMKQEKHLDHIFRDMITEAKRLIGAEETCLFLVVDSPTATSPSVSMAKEKDSKGKYLYTKYVDGSFERKKGTHVPLGRGIISRTALSGEAVNTYDARTEPDFDGSCTERSVRIKNMACAPVFDRHRNVIAVIQAVNKVGEGCVQKGKGFTTNDMNVLQALATHISVSLQDMSESEDDAKMRLRDTIHLLREHGGSDRHSDSQRKRRPLFPEAALE